MKKKYVKTICVIAGIITSIIISGCIDSIENNLSPDYQDTNQQIDTTGNDVFVSEPLPPVNVEFFFSEDPALNKEVNLILNVTSLQIVEYAEMQITLPKGFELITGEPKWEGKLEPGTTYSVNVRVKSIQKGRWEIEGSVYGYYKYPEGTPSDYDLHFTPHLYVDIKDGEVKVSEIPLINNWKNSVGPSGSSNDDGLISELSFSESPLLNKEVSLSYILKSSVQLDNAMVSIIFPEQGMELVKISSATLQQKNSISMIDLSLIEGTHQYYWKGTIPEDSSIIIKMSVKSTLTGSGYVYSTVQTTGTDPTSQTAVMSITVDDFSANYKSG